MRALLILQKELNVSLDFIHSKTRKALWRAVEGVLSEGRLWLTALGRSLPGLAYDKHKIKAADRLIGNKKLHSQLQKAYTAYAHWLLKHIQYPIILVDWTGVGKKDYALSAALAYNGRSLPLYTRVYPKKKQNNPKVHREFIRVLSEVLPQKCKPTVVTDAGFHSAWFDAVTNLGWDYVGRIRNRTKALIDGQWQPIKALYKLAGNRKAKNLGMLCFPRNRPVTRRLVLSKLPRIKGRKRYTSKGSVKRGIIDQRHSSQAHEPWLLATSLSCNPKAVVKIYALRMQIEEFFRDEKNHRHGWSLEDIGCKSALRIEVLLFIAALANLVLNAVGHASERMNLQRRFQANTIRNRRVLSLFVLGRLVMKNRSLLQLIVKELYQSFSCIRREIRQLCLQLVG